MNKRKLFVSGVQGNEVIHYRYNNRMECIFINNITYFKSDGGYSSVYIAGNTQIEKKICKTLKYIESNLREKGFIRCHKFYLINIARVEFFSSRNNIVSIAGCIIQVSRRESSSCFRLLLENGKKDVD